MYKMGSHHPFRHLKHKLWSKERSKVKLLVWLPTTKSQESTRFPCVQATCNIPLESSWRGLQLFFRPHYNWRSSHEVMGAPKSRESQVWEFRDFHLGVPGQKGHLDVAPMERCREYYKGEGGGFPQVRAVVSLVSPSSPMARLSTKSAQTMH
jgi:hypothetical protein